MLVSDTAMITAVHLKICFNYHVLWTCWHPYHMSFILYLLHKDGNSTWQYLSTPQLKELWSKSKKHSEIALANGLLLRQNNRSFVYLSSQLMDKDHKHYFFLWNSKQHFK